MFKQPKRKGESQPGWEKKGDYVVGTPAADKNGMEEGTTIQ